MVLKYATKVHHYSPRGDRAYGEINGEIVQLCMHERVERGEPTLHRFCLKKMGHHDRHHYGL